MMEGREYPRVSQESPCDCRGSALCPGDEAADPRIEEYLDVVCAAFDDAAASGKRQGIRAEIRAHLYALVASYQELGEPRTEAIEKALRRFGEARAVARQLGRAYARDLPVEPLRRTTLSALKCFGTAAVAALAYLALGGPASAMDRVWSVTSVDAWVAGFGMPFAAGLLTSQVTGRRGQYGRATLYALVILVAATLGVTLLGGLAMVNSASARTALAGVGHLLTVFLSVVLLQWPAVGCAAAMLGSRLTKRSGDFLKRRLA